MKAIAVVIQRTILVALWNSLIEIIILLDYLQKNILLEIMNLLCLPDQLMTGMNAVLFILSGPHVTEAGIMIIETALQCADHPLVVRDLHIAGRNPPMAGRDPPMVGRGPHI
jgi:hypothetical protein